MTKEETKIAAHVMTGYLEGKPVEFRLKQAEHWKPDVSGLQWNWDSYEYRIQPEKKKRLLKAEELPRVFWVRQRGKVYAWELFVGFEIGQRAMKLARGHVVNFNETALEHFEWSPDRKEVRSFEVEE